MLIQFSVSNFLSIKDKVTLSMTATSDLTLPDNVIKDRYLTSSVIYGANASGKSNVLRAFAFLEYFVTQSHTLQKGDKIGVVPFLMDYESSSKPSSFEVHFINNDVRHIYGFSIDSEKVHKEYLYSFPYGRKKTIFERGFSIPYYFTTDRRRQTTIAESTLDNTLYLSKAAQANYKPVFSSFDWFDRTLKAIIMLTTDYSFVGYTGSQILKDITFKNKVLNFLKEADIEIRDIEVNLVEVTNKTDDGKLKTEKQLEISTIHSRKSNKNIDSDIMKLNLNDESNGTIKYFGLIGPLIDVLEHGYVLVYDEIDTKLHPKLTRFIVSLFNNPQTNPHSAQLIFNTHDVNLLDTELLRRDQIWFTEKKTDGSTDLYPLSDYKPRKDEKLMKNYLLGRYGAIPILGRATLLCEEENK